MYVVRVDLISSMVAVLTALLDLGTAAISVHAPCPGSCSCLGNMVDCSGRQLRHVPDNLPLWVEALDISSNDFVRIPADAFFGLDRLQELNVNGNKLEAIGTNVFERLPRLQILKASHNILDRLWETNHTTNLTHLILSHNVLSQLRASMLEQHSNLHVLDLSSNNIGRLRNETFPPMESLHQLFLSDNQIELMEKGAFDNVTSLKWLKLNKNKLSSLPPNIFSQLNKLEYLELCQNRLRRLEALRFQGLTSLVTLRLKRNALTGLMDGAFWGLSKIQNLQLDHNSLAKIGSGFLFGLDALEHLSVSHNKLISIEGDSWTSCRHLLELNLSHNGIRSISPTMFAKLESLQRLRLNHNRISHISDHSFRDLTSLRVLDLSNNEISSTLEDSAGAFLGLLSLTRLTLDNNLIKSVARRAFNGLNQLKQLHLAGNNISSVHSEAFESLRHLEQFTFNSTSLFCDCHVTWLPSWLRRTGFHLTTSAVCGYPISVIGWNVLDVSSESFKCDDFAKPKITRDPRSHIALKGGTLNLTCKAVTSSHLVITIAWKKDQLTLRLVVTTSVSAKNSKGLSEYTSQLLIGSVKNENAGSYQCVASNLLGTAYSAKAEILVSVYPRFVKIPRDVTVRAGSTARLECSASGRPTPEVAWTKDGGYDFPAARERRMHVMPSDDVFFIVGVTREDQGVYTCAARNGAGVVRTNATLVVQMEPSFPTTPRFRNTLLGSTAVLECLSSRQESRNKVTWLKDDHSLTLTPRHHLAADSQLLVITGVETSDAGEYTCVVSNLLGSERLTMKLDVLAITEDDGANKNFMNGSRSGGSDKMRILVIVAAVVACVIGTSLVWVVVIYRLGQRKRLEYTVTRLEDFQGLNPCVLGFEKSLLQTLPVLRHPIKHEALFYSQHTSPTSSPCDHSSPDELASSMCPCLDSGCFCDELVKTDDNANGRLRAKEGILSLVHKHRSDRDYTPPSAKGLPIRMLAVEALHLHSLPYTRRRKKGRFRRDAFWKAASDGDVSSTKHCCRESSACTRPTALANNLNCRPVNSNCSISSCSDKYVCNQLLISSSPHGTVQSILQ